MVLSPARPGASIGDGNAKAYAPTIKHGVGSHARFHLQGENRSLPRLLATETDARKIATLRKLLVRKKPSSPTGMRRTVSPEPAQPLSQSRFDGATKVSLRPRGKRQYVGCAFGRAIRCHAETPLSNHHDATQ